MSMLKIAAASLALAAASAANPTPAARPKFEPLSDADKKVYNTDIKLAAKTIPDLIRSKTVSAQCKPPTGFNLGKLGFPTAVMERSTAGSKTVAPKKQYVYRYKNGAYIVASNGDKGQKGGDFKITCVRVPKDGEQTVTKKPSHPVLKGDDSKELQAAFDKADKNGDGTITTGGAYMAFHNLYAKKNSAFASSKFFEQTLEKESITAAGKDKVCDLDEFLCAARYLQKVAEVYDDFHGHDKNHNDTLERSELEAAMIQFFMQEKVNTSVLETIAAQNKAKAQAKKAADETIANYDKNHDDTVSFTEFESLAFRSIHFNPNGSCKTSETPVNQSEIAILKQVFTTFGMLDGDKTMSTSEFYQFAALLDTNVHVEGAKAGWSLGCKGTKQHTRGNFFGKGKQGTGMANSGKTDFQFPSGGKPTAGKGRSLVEIIARSLQQRGDAPPARGSGSGRRPQFHKPTQKDMKLTDAMEALREDADKNDDDIVSFGEALHAMQGVKEVVGDQKFRTLLAAAKTIKPVDCKKATSCQQCADPRNAGLCGWTAETTEDGMGGGGLFGGRKLQGKIANPFFGGSSQKGGAKGACAFVDRDEGADEQNEDADAGTTTCISMCPRPQFGNGGRGGQQQNGGRGGAGGRGSAGGQRASGGRKLRTV